jgi:hypothetical protein
MAFAVEVIPDEARLFRRIHQTQYDDKTGVVSSAAFRHDRMSVNWEKYSNAGNSTDQNSSAVVALIAGDCRPLGQTIEHTPIEPDQPTGPNQAHAEVCGAKKGVISRQLRDLAKIVWLRSQTSA